MSKNKMVPARGKKRDPQAETDYRVSVPVWVSDIITEQGKLDNRKRRAQTRHVLTTYARDCQ